jgi:hypothetical protein
MYRKVTKTNFHFSDKRHKTKQIFFRISCTGSTHSIKQTSGSPDVCVIHVQTPIVPNQTGHRTNSTVISTLNFVHSHQNIEIIETIASLIHIFTMTQHYLALLGPIIVGCGRTDSIFDRHPT